MTAASHGGRDVVKAELGIQLLEWIDRPGYTHVDGELGHRVDGHVDEPAGGEKAHALGEHAGDLGVGGER
jgi:hypothetical protein